MSDQNAPAQIADTKLVLPPFGKIPALTLQMGRINEAKLRLVEAKSVNPITYADLEHCYNEAYRDLKRHLSAIGYQIALVSKAMEIAKADALLDKYPDFMKDRPKNQDNAATRDAFLIRDEAYVAALDRFNQLKALESNMDGEVRVLERTCAYMKKQMDLVLRSGLSGKDLYVSSGRK